MTKLRDSRYLCMLNITINAQIYTMMKKCMVLVGVLLFVFSINTDVYGQRNGGQNDDIDQYFDESGGFAHRLWYGGGFALGFSGGNVSSSFQLGISPMVGYKLDNNFSVGPRFSVLYTHYRVRLLNGEVETANPMSYSAAAFGRYKVFKALFAHAEYEIESEGYAFFDNSTLVTDRIQRNNVYLGAGYNSSAGLFGYEILVLYNVNQPENTLDSPVSFRFGITYKF